MRGALRILIAPDKFKGTLSAEEAARAIRLGWATARPLDQFTLLPFSDGGDGFGEVMGRLIGARSQSIRTVDAAHRPIRARWWWHAATQTAIIESAAVIGLAMLPPKRFHPFELDTLGLGAVLRAARAKGARRCLVGLGGSATNDAGFGLARALGWQFVDNHRNAIESWTDLSRLNELRPPPGGLLTFAATKREKHWDLTVAVDVKNPLLGARGATRVYGPQKGVRPRDYRLAEACLGRLAQVCRRDLGEDFSRRPGAGAAGGLGFGLMAFAGARLERGFEVLARQAGLDRQVRSADLVITGEGTIDASTAMGKAAGEIARRCRRLGKPCLALAGVVRQREKVAGVFTELHALTELTSASRAQAEAAIWLRRLAEQAAHCRCRFMSRASSCAAAGEACAPNQSAGAAWPGVGAER